MGHRLFLGLAIIMFTCLQVQGQVLKIDTSYSPAHLVDKILSGQGLRVGNVKLTGLNHSICFFSMDTNVIGMKSGIMLSTGSVFDIAKANTSPGTSGICWDYFNNRKYRSDRDLNLLCRGRTYDQVILEFDFVPFHNNVSFKFSFASEEYTEYVGTEFNDVFAFIVTGPGMKKKNLAVIPGTNEAITINNINHKKHKKLYINNHYFLNYGMLKKGHKKKFSLKQLWNQMFNQKNKADGYYYLQGKKKKLNQIIVENFGYDGFTKVLKASCYLRPGQVYHLKIAIGDVGDTIFDSGVFLEAGSLVSVKDTTEPNFKNYPEINPNKNWDTVFNPKKPPFIVIDTTNQIDEAFEITNINFDTDEYVIPDSSKRKLELLAAYLIKNRQFRLRLIGYTDNVGSKRYNQTLSENRSIAVMNYLTSKGILPSRMNYVGYNFENPVADNTTDEGRAMNRRVEILIIDE